MSSRAEDQARLDGQMATLHGAAASANPHPLNTSISRAWARGHREISEAKAASRRRARA